MGNALAGNLVAAGHDVLAYDVGGPERCPDGARFASDVSAVAAGGRCRRLQPADGSSPRRSVVELPFGQSVGLDMGTMLEVLNASSGQSAATTDKFPNHVLTGHYGSGFANSLMSKDLDLYLGAVEALGGPTAIGQVTASVWKRFAATEPDVDFTRIFPFVRGS